MNARTPSLRQLRASRPDNVEILPTAAPRQVQQEGNRHSRAARARLQRKHAHHFDYCFPTIRRQERAAETIMGIKKEPGFILAAAILETLSEDDRLRVIGKLATMASSDAGLAALEWAKATMLCNGDKLSLCQAMERLAAREEKGR